MSLDYADRELDAILKDLHHCGGPRSWHLEDMLKIIGHTRQLLAEVKAAVAKLEMERPYRISGGYSGSAGGIPP